MKREVIVDGDPRLREMSTPVEKVTKKTRKLVEDMFETMYASNGIGLAAPQVGVNERVIVIDLQRKGARPVALVNPEVTARSGEQEGEEGCLSCPGINGNVRRAATVTVEALDTRGRNVVIDADGLFAVCLQHEIDHLDGVLFIDRMTSEERARAEARRVTDAGGAM